MRYQRWLATHKSVYNRNVDDPDVTASIVIYNHVMKSSVIEIKPIVSDGTVLSVKFYKKISQDTADLHDSDYVWRHDEDEMGEMSEVSDISDLESSPGSDNTNKSFVVINT